MYTPTLNTSVSMMSFPSCAFRKPCMSGVALLYLNTVSLPGVFWLEKWVGKKIGCHSKGFSTHLPKVWYFWSVYFLFFVFITFNDVYFIIRKVCWFQVLSWSGKPSSSESRVCEALTWPHRFKHMRSLGSLRSPTLVFIPCSELCFLSLSLKYWLFSCDLEAALGHRHSPIIHHSFTVQDTELLSSCFSFCPASSFSSPDHTDPCSQGETPGFYAVLQASLTEAYVSISEVVFFREQSP